MKELAEQRPLFHRIVCVRCFPIYINLYADYRFRRAFVMHANYIMQNILVPRGRVCENPPRFCGGYRACCVPHYCLLPAISFFLARSRSP